MKRNLFVSLFVCLALLCFACGDSPHGGGDDSNGMYPKGSLLMLELNPEEDGFDCFATDGDTDIGILNYPETGRPVFATVSDRASGETFGIFFSEEGYPAVYAYNDTYFALNNFSGTRADMAFIDETGEITVYRDMETGVDWESGFYEFWNSPHTRSINWDRLGRTFYDEFKEDGRLVLIGAGYAVKAIPAMMGMLSGDPRDYTKFAYNFVEMLDEKIIKDNWYIRTTREALEAETALVNAGEIVSCYSGNVSSCVSNLVSKLFDKTGDIIINAADPETELAIQTGGYVLAGGYGTIQVTLSWNNVNDIDLHVTDPNGETIYWRYPTSVSGGYLDFDNTVAYGPENIYWKEAWLIGDYSVYVHHYSGLTSANYKVVITAFGRSKTVSGSIGINEMRLVAIFDEKQIYTDVYQEYLSKPLEVAAFGKKPPATELRGEARKGTPDLQKLKDRLVRSRAGVY
jgi:hypothetical protein